MSPYELNLNHVYIIPIKDRKRFENILNRAFEEGDYKEEQVLEFLESGFPKVTKDSIHEILVETEVSEKEKEALLNLSQEPKSPTEGEVKMAMELVSNFILQYQNKNK